MKYTTFLVTNPTIYIYNYLNTMDDHTIFRFQLPPTNKTIPIHI